MELIEKMGAKCEEVKYEPVKIAVDQHFLQINVRNFILETKKFLTNYKQDYLKHISTETMRDAHWVLEIEEQYDWADQILKEIEKHEQI